MSEGIIAVQATAPRYLKGAVDNTIRNRLWLAMLKKHNRIKTGDHGAVSLTWDVEFSEPEIRQNGDAGQQVFTEHDAYRQLTIDVRGYVGTDRLTLKKKLMNDSPLAIVNLYDRKLPKLIKSMTNNFGNELYIDGYATGNGNRLIGMESFLGDDGNTVAADLVANPSDTYADRSTALAALGGTWSSGLGSGNYPNATIATDWPYGQGTSEYDYIAPKLINYTSSSWPTGSILWRDNCSAVMRRARTWCKSVGGEGRAPYCHMLSPELYDAFEDYQEDKFRTVVPHKSSQDLGFEDTLNFNGAAVKHEFDVPAGVGYGLNLNEMLLSSIHDDFFYSFGPEWDTKSLSYLYLVGFFGNIRFSSPKHFAKYAAYA